MCLEQAYRSGGPLPPPSSGAPRSLAEALRRATAARPGGGLTVYSGPGEASFLTYRALLASALRIARGLRREVPAGSDALLADDLPPVLELCGFWGCILAGVRVHLLAPGCQGQGQADAQSAAQRLALAWRSLGEPPILAASAGTGTAGANDGGGGLPARLPGHARLLGLDALLRASEDADVEPHEGVPRGSDPAFLLLCGSGLADMDAASVPPPPAVYACAHAAVLAHARAEEAVLGGCVEEGPLLNWLPLAHPWGAMMHSATVYRVADEVRAATWGEPRATLRLAARHGAQRVAGPPAFFRRAAAAIRGGAAAASADLRCVRRWLVLGPGLGPGEAADFAQLAGGAPSSLTALLLAPWGALAAQSAVAAGEGTWLPVPGVELRSFAAEGSLQARGTSMAPGVLRKTGKNAPAGWVDLPHSGSEVVGDEEEAITVAGGVTYMASEVEAAVEAAPGVRPGSAVAVTAGAQGGLAVAFSPEDPSASAAPIAVAAVHNHLAVALGIRPKALLPLPPCDVPRDATGRPSRAAARRLLQAAQCCGEAPSGPASVAAEACQGQEDLLPASWVFEEEFVACPLGEGALEGEGVEGHGEDGDADDGDDVEERMEGVAVLLDDIEPERHMATSSTTPAIEEPLQPRALVVYGKDAQGLAAALSAQLRDRLKAQGVEAVDCCILGAAPLAERLPALVDRQVQFVVHCGQCGLVPEADDGREDAAQFLTFLQGLEVATRGAREVNGGRLRLLCVSTGRHMRVAGECADARKSLSLGVLLCAAAEWPWLSATQLDAAPGIDSALLAEAAVAELLHGADGGRAASPEVLLDAEGRRLLRRLRPAALTPNAVGGSAGSAGRQPLRAALLAGGAGGIGLLWAKMLDASALLLLGRSPATAPRVQAALAALSGGGADVFYLRADISDRQQVEGALRRCPAAPHVDFAASLAEAFQPPMPLASLPADAMQGPAAKLRGARHLLDVLAALRPLATRRSAPTPVLLASSAVGLLGAARLAPYAAGVRALEAACAVARLSPTSPLDPRCVALSAWADIGITSNFPVLAQAAPAAGLHVLSQRCGVLALEAVFRRFAAPRFGMLAVGVNAAHPRFAALAACDAAAGAAAPAATGSVPGCVEIVQGAARKVLGLQVKLGDSLVEAGLDSMSSLTMHASLVSMTGGLDLPASIFYDHPTVLEVATFIHRKAAEVAGKTDDGPGGSLDSALERLLEDDDARRSYHLAQARDALRRGDHAEAATRAARAAEGAAGAALAAAMAAEAEAREALGNVAAAGAAHREALAAREACSGRLHPDTAVAIARLLRWAKSVGAGAEATQLLSRLDQARHLFLRGVAWPLPPWLLPEDEPPPAVFGVAAGAGLMQLRELNLDGQQLDGLPLGALGSLGCMEVLRLRRAGLAEVPEAFGGLVQLRELWLTGNGLSDLPTSLSALTRLRLLALEGNLLGRLPEVVPRFRRLVHLSLDEQRRPLLGLAAGEARLPAQVLAVLRARGCGAEFPDLIPPSMGPPNLNTVFWANNALTQVPACMAAFAPSLRLLDLAHNQIAGLGDELFCLSTLRDLSLAGNRLRSLPRAVGRLRCLQQLWLHGNALEELPEELGELDGLAILELHHNHLRELPLSAVAKLRKLNWLFAHGNALKDGAGLMRTLARLPRLKICGLGANQLDLDGVDLRGLRASYGLGWNQGLKAEEGVLTEALTTCDLYWDRMAGHSDEAPLQEVLVVTFSAQGAPVAQGQAEVRALRDAMLKVDALYVCDPANAWYMQDPDFKWEGLAYFDRKIRSITDRYRHVFMWGGSMGGSAALLFACLGHCVHAFSPQVDLAFTWPSFATEAVRDRFRHRLQDSVLGCRGTVTVHVGEDNHNDNRHAAALPPCVKVHLHDTANHNTMKHVKQRDKLLPLLKLEVLHLMTAGNAEVEADRL